MPKSSKRNQTEGVIDRLVGRLLEMVGKLTGKKSRTGKGKAARARGSARTTKARTKRAGR